MVRMARNSIIIMVKAVYSSALLLVPAALQ